MEQNFTQGKIFKPLVLFAIPIFFALFLQAMYGAVDLLIIGRFSTTADVSAVATGSMFMQTVAIAITGLSMGVTIFIGQKIGEGDAVEAGKIIGNGILIFTILAIVSTIVLFIISTQISTMLQAPAKALALTSSYIKICGAGSIFIVGYNLLGSIFRGIGDSKTPLIVVAIACVINVILDLLFIAVFKMGTSGAAIATILAQAIGVAISIILIKKQELPFDFSIHSIRFNKAIIKKIFLLGTPIALQELLVGISFMVIQAIVNTMGVVASAGVGVAEKVCAFIMLVASAYMQSMSAFVAQNIGAAKPERARKALIYSITTSFIIGAVLGYFSFFHGDVLASVFAKDKEVIYAAHSYLKAYAIDCLFTAFSFCFIGFYNGCGQTMFVMFQGVFAAFCIRIPVAFLMSCIPGTSLFYIGLCIPISTIAQIILCLIMYHHIKKTKIKAC